MKDYTSLATSLYEQSLDMDWMDYKDTREDDIHSLVSELEEMEKQGKFKTVLTALEYITGREVEV